MTEEELDLKCDELFNLVPIPFNAKKGENYALEKEIERLITQMGITIPIMHVKGQVYLIGTSKCIIQNRADQIMVRVGGGYVPFDEYIPNNHRLFERALLVHMIKSQESLEWVCDALIFDKRIPQANQYQYKKNQNFDVNGNDMLVINRRLAARAAEKETPEKVVQHRFGNNSPSKSPSRLRGGARPSISPTRRSLRPQNSFGGSTTSPSSSSKKKSANISPYRKS